MKKTILSILGLLYILTNGYSQQNTDSLIRKRHYDIERDKYISMLASYHYWQQNYVELGLAINQSSRFEPHGHGSEWAYYISNEVRIDENIIIGPKIGGWISGGAGAMALGMSMIYYTDFKGGSLRFRPEIGIGGGGVKMFYGYNIALTNKDFEGINHHLAGITFLLGIRKIKEVREDYKKRIPKE